MTYGSRYGILLIKMILISLQPVRGSKKRKSIPSSKLTDSVVESTLGLRDAGESDILNKEYRRAHIFYGVMS